MAVFFLLIGSSSKEIYVGELSSMRRSLLPATRGGRRQLTCRTHPLRLQCRHTHRTYKLGNSAATDIAVCAGHSGAAGQSCTVGPESALVVAFAVIDDPGLSR